MGEWDGELFDPATLRPAVSVVLLCELGTELGVPIEACLHETGVDPATLSDAADEVTVAQELRVISNLVGAVDDAEGLGLRAGRRYRLTTYGIWGFAVLSSPTMGDAVDTALEFLELTYPLTRISARPAPGAIEIVYDDRRVPDSVRCFVLERDVAATAMLWCEALDEHVPPVRVNLRLPAPAHPGRFWDALGIDPVFGASESIIAFDERLLKRPLPRAAPLTAKLCVEQCRGLLEQRRARGGLSGRVRGELLRAPGALPTQDAVAAALHTSVRTLRRQLAGEGTSFRRLVEQARLALARDLLATGDLTVEEVAGRAGYSEASNFVHAFRRWEGITPGRWMRARARGKAGISGDSG